MVYDFLWLVTGLVVLVIGGEWLVRGAAGIARSFGVSPLVVGLTVVSFGTSAPELAVNVSAILQGRAELPFGNVVGSNIANVGLVLACGALVRPLMVTGSVVPREIPTMLLATAAAFVMALDTILRGQVSEFDRTDGVLLLLLFCIFLYNAARDALSQRAAGGFRDDVERSTASVEPRSLVKNLFLVVGGAFGLAGGATLTVDSAASIARALDVPEAIIGLTLVAFGTSLPELVATIVAARRGETDIAVGNVVGSNIFNLLFVLGVTASIGSVQVPAGGVWDFAAASLFSVLVLCFSVVGPRRISRPEGGVLLVGYCAFMLWRCL